MKLETMALHSAADKLDMEAHERAAAAGVADPASEEAMESGSPTRARAAGEGRPAPWSAASGLMGEGLMGTDREGCRASCLRRWRSAPEKREKVEREVAREAGRSMP